MTISKEKLNKIVFEVAELFLEDMSDFQTALLPDFGIPKVHLLEFVYTLLKRIESDCEFVGTIPIDYTEKLTNLSLVEDKS